MDFWVSYDPDENSIDFCYNIPRRRMPFGDDCFVHIDRLIELFQHMIDLYLFNDFGIMFNKESSRSDIHTGRCEDYLYINIQTLHPEYEIHVDLNGLEKKIEDKFKELVFNMSKPLLEYFLDE
jgi:hypothetical protein